MQILDIILIVALSGFVFYGLFFGFIRTLGLFMGLLVGAFLASRLYLPVSGWVEPLFFGFNNLGKVLVFTILFSLINRLVGLLFLLINKAFNLISIIPFLKTINRLAGALLGFFTGALTLGLLLYVASRYVVVGTLINYLISRSEVAPMLIKINALLLPLLPEVLKRVRSVI